MDDSRKTKAQLIAELQQARAELKAADHGHGDASPTVASMKQDKAARKQAEQQLLETQELLQEAMAGSQHVFYRYDGEQDRITYFSDPRGVLGKDFEDLTGKALADCYAVTHPDDHEAVTKAFQQAAARGGDDPIPLEIEYRVRRGDGEWIWMRNRSILIAYEQGGIKRMTGSLVDISDQRRAARRLRASEESLRAFIRAMPDVAIVLDGDGRYVDTYSDETLLYRPPEALRGKLMHDVLPKDVADPALEAIRETLRTGESQQLEYEMDVPAGHRWFEGRTSPLRIGDDDDRVVWVARDTTDRHLAEDRLKQTRDELEVRVAERTAELRRSERSERAFREQLTRLQEVNVILGKIDDVDTLCRRAVELGRERLGFSRLGIWFLDRQRNVMCGSFRIDERGELSDERGRYRRLRGDEVDHRVIRGEMPAGVWRDVPLRNARGEVAGVGTMASAAMWDGEDVIGKVIADNLLDREDFTPTRLEVLRLLGVTLGHLCTRTRAEEALQASEEKYRQLVESTTDLVWAIDLTGQVTFANSAAREMVGIEPGEAIGMASFDVMHPDDQPIAMEQLQRSIETGEGWSGLELRYVHADGTVRYVESTGRAVHGSDGELLGFSGIDRDFTQRRNAERALREAHLELISARESERRDLAKELHDSVAQDLVVLQLMVKTMQADGGGHENCAGVSNKLSEVIADIRRICHGLYPPMLESLGLAHALRYFSELYQSTSTEVVCECDDEVQTRRFQPEVEITLYRVAQEATSNAIRHGQAGCILLRLDVADGELRLEVEDDGEGFDPGGRDKPGLGLQSMRDRVTSIDGVLAIESQPQRTIIRVTVPVETSQR